MIKFLYNRGNTAYPRVQRLHSGFTLLETVIAVGIILFGLVSLVTLNISSLNTSTVTSDEFLAANFAREAVEVVRSIRDSNWLVYDTDSTTAWNTGLIQDGDTDYTFIPEFTGGNFNALDVEPDNFGHICTGASSQTYDCSAIWKSNTERYFQIVSSAFNPSNANFSQTSFSRLIYLYPICRDSADLTSEGILDDTTSSTCAAEYGSTYEHVGIDVVVTLQWASIGGTQTYTLEEYIYDWRY